MSSADRDTSEDEAQSLLSGYSRSASDIENVGNDLPVNDSAEPTDGRLGRRWISIYVMYFTMFLGAVTFSIVVSSLFPFLQLITNGQTDTITFGVVVAAYSAGQLVASPLFGFWSDKRPTREPLIVSLVLSVATNILYCYTQAFPSNISKYIMMVSRALVGFGAGNGAVARSYVSAATTKSERTSAFAGISASQAIGFILGPVLGMAFVPLGNSGYHYGKYFFFNLYTGPGFLSALLAVVNIFLVIFVFKDRRLAHARVAGRMRAVDRSYGATISTSNSNINTSQNTANLRYMYDRIAAYTCVVLFFALFFGFALYETIITPYSMDEFAWSKKMAVLYNNIMFGALAVLAIFTFIGLKLVTKYIDERVVFIVGLFLMAFGFFALIPMGNDKPYVGISMININYTLPEGSAEIPLISNATVPVGCRYPKLHWCLDIPKLTLYQYILGMILLGIGYPVATVLCYSLYSKILGPHPQGIMMGVLTATGSSARIVGPLFVTTLYDLFGPQIAFATVVGLLAMAIVILTSFCYRLVPFGTPKGCAKIIHRS